MKALFVILSLIISTSAFADLGEKFCIEKAQAYFEGYHQRVKDEIGVIQGLQEAVSLEYSQKINEIDQRDEIYHFSVRAENEDGDYWVWEYVINIEAWLGAGGKAHTCSIIDGMTFLGVTEQSAD